ADLRTWTPPNRPIAFVFAWPPCDHLAVSGARWFRGKGLRALALSIELFAVAAEVCEASGAPYMIENPVSTISTYWREPDFMFDPASYALFADDADTEAYTKRTCLWTGGGFVMPDHAGVDPVLGSVMHRVPPGPDRKNIRSATPTGFARAVFAANSTGERPNAPLAQKGPS
ncbi:MAG: hypothetical protein KDA25_07405, partial [Phycisphaerales bacterium]|nr:hypothetical protein [Phycisphaerales bacterium]